MKTIVSNNMVCASASLKPLFQSLRYSVLLSSMLWPAWTLGKDWSLGSWFCLTEPIVCTQRRQWVGGLQGLALSPTASFPAPPSEAAASPSWGHFSRGLTATGPGPLQRRGGRYFLCDGGAIISLLFVLNPAHSFIFYPFIKLMVMRV